MIEAEVGLPVPLELMLPDGNVNRHVRVYLQKADGTDLGVVDLPHMARGRYAALHTFAEEGFVYTDYITYSDPSFNSEDLLYTRRSEVYRIVENVDLAASFAAIPIQVWTYPVRLVTNDFSDLATHADIDVVRDLTLGLSKTTYVNKMSTTFNSVTGQQEVLVWCTKDGLLVVGEQSSVVVKNAAGSVIWSATLTSPNPDGIYRYISPVDVPPDGNFYIVIGIHKDGQMRINLQSFFSVA